MYQRLAIWYKYKILTSKNKLSIFLKSIYLLSIIVLSSAVMFQDI